MASFFSSKSGVDKSSHSKKTDGGNVPQGNATIKEGEESGQGETDVVVWAADLFIQWKVLCFLSFDTHEHFAYTAKVLSGSFSEFLAKIKGNVVDNEFRA